MRIGAISQDSSSSAWELYDSYRRTRAAEQSGGQTGAPNAADTQESKETKKVNGSQGCETCKNRKYQDGSDDPGVSFKTPTKLTPEQASTAVRGHEMEHVSREQGKASREEREVVSQSVTYNNAICPECGRAYISGGTTRTTTRARTEQAYQSGMESGSGGEKREALNVQA